MQKPYTVLVDEGDERAIQELAACLRAGGRGAQQLRDFAISCAEDQPVQGLKFQPYPGQILVCQFGIGFQRPEIVKTRPVMVISPQPRFRSGLCTVVPISSRRPETIYPYHFQLPSGILNDSKYKEAWVKADLVQTVGLHRLDRLKTGFRKYYAPVVSDEVLRCVRRCVLHATGMHMLTELW